MPDKAMSKSTFPEDTLAISNAVAESLERLNEAQSRQFASTAQLATDILQSMIGLVAKANQLSKSGANQKMLDSLKQHADNASLKATLTNDNATEIAAKNLTAAGATNDQQTTIIDTALAGEAAKSLSRAYENAVNSQQQQYILAQASLTQGITTLYSIVSAAVAVSEKNNVETTTVTKSAAPSQVKK